VKNRAGPEAGLFSSESNSTEKYDTGVVVKEIRKEQQLT
jgi:hypothetical protein